MGKTILEALNVRVVGSGEQIVVFGHGVGTEQSVWKSILPNFTKDYRVILYDLVCAGSVNPEHFDFQRYSTLDGFVDDLLSILEALSVKRCFYVGHSISGMIGCLAAIRRPDLFAKLVLVGASPWYYNDEEYRGGFEVVQVEELFSLMESNYEAWVNGYAPLAVGADVPAAVREFSRTLFNMRPDITLFVSRMVFKSDFRGVLGLVNVPCCIMQTAKDVAAPHAVALYLRDNLAGKNTIEMLHTDGHLPHLSAPALFSHSLRRVLSIGDTT